MSERWVLVPMQQSQSQYDAITRTGRRWTEENSKSVYETQVAARPPVSREWLEAAVERGARALCPMPWDETPASIRRMLLKQARAAILAALELEDTP